MKKSTIWFLTIIMALTLSGLLYVQIMYMNNMKKMRDDQFAEGVKRSLYAVSTSLEQNEAKYFLEEDMSSLQSDLYPRVNPDGSVGINNTFTTPEGINYDLSLKMKVDRRTVSPSMRELMRGKYLYQKGLLDEVILSILNQSSNRPITERADSAEVARYLRSELDNNGLSLPFEFAVVNRIGAFVYKSAGFSPSVKDQSSMFVQTLFPNDPKNKMYYLKVYFPTRSDYIFDSIRFMIPSFIFSFILLVTFVCTIILAFRQKKLTEMKNDFINNMTHEFKTPISTISLAAQMLNDNAVLKSPAMLGHISTVINDETKRLRFQVEKVLQKATLRLQNVDANQIIAGITSTFKLKVEKYGGHIETFLGAKESTVNVDEMHFTNVIFNLLDNAVKYRREDVPLELKVSTRNVKAHAARGSKEDIRKILPCLHRQPPRCEGFRARARLCEEDGERTRGRNKRGERNQCRNKIYNNSTNNSKLRNYGRSFAHTTM